MAPPTKKDLDRNTSALLENNKQLIDLNNHNKKIVLAQAKKKPGGPGIEQPPIVSDDNRQPSERAERASKVEKSVKERQQLKGPIMGGLLTATMATGEKGAGFGGKDLVNLINPAKMKTAWMKAAKGTAAIISSGMEKVHGDIVKYDDELVKVNKRYGLFVETVKKRGELGAALLRPDEVSFTIKVLGENNKMVERSVETLAELGITHKDVADSTIELGNASSHLRNIFLGTDGQIDKNAKGLAQLAAVFKRVGVETKTFGALSDHVAKTFGKAWKGDGEASKSIKHLQTQLHSVARIMGQDVNVVTEEFNQQLENLAFVGMQDAIEKFTDLKMLSETTGIALENIVKSTKKFDDFKSAGQQVGQLNAALRGSYTNSRAFMAALGDPAKQMNIVQDAIIKAHKAGTFKLSKNTAVRYAQVRQIQKAAGDISRADALKLLGAIDEDARKESAKLEAKKKKKLEEEALAKDPNRRLDQSSKGFARLTTSMERNLSITEKHTLLQEKNMQQLAKSGKFLGSILDESMKGIDSVSTEYLKFFGKMDGMIENFVKYKNIVGTAGLIGAIAFGDDTTVAVVKQYIENIDGLTESTNNLFRNFEEKMPGFEKQLKGIHTKYEELKKRVGKTIDETVDQPTEPAIEQPPIDESKVDDKREYHIHVNVDEKQFASFVLEKIGEQMGVRTT